MSVFDWHVFRYIFLYTCASNPVWSEKMQRTDPAEKFKVILTESGVLNVVIVQIHVLA